MHCVRECGKIIRVCQYQQHLKGACQTHYHQLVDSPTKVTISEVLSRSSTSPATPTEARVAEHLIKKFIDKESPEGFIKIPRQRGAVSKLFHSNKKYITLFKFKQPRTLAPLPNPRVPSSKASRWTLGRRTKRIGKVRTCSSRGEDAAQMAHEVKSLSKEEREKLLSDAQLPIHIPCNEALALKTDLSIPWNKLRVLRR